MKYRLNIAQADLNTKNKQVIKFLSAGHQVKITIMFKGREVSHPELGVELFRKIAEVIGGIVKIPSVDPVLKGRDMVITLTPKQSKPS